MINALSSLCQTLERKSQMRGVELVAKALDPRTESWTRRVSGNFHARLIAATHYTELGGKFQCKATFLSPALTLLRKEMNGFFRPAGLKRIKSAGFDKPIHGVAFCEKLTPRPAGRAWPLCVIRVYSWAESSTSASRVYRTVRSDEPVTGTGRLLPVGTSSTDVCFVLVCGS